MASRKKPTTAKLHTTEDFAPQMSEIIEKEPVVIEEKDILTENEVKDLEPEEVVEVKAPIVEVKPAKKAKKTEKVGPKYPIGSIVFISKEADADLNGFKLFPQYKKCTYTVEAYDEITGVYSLRRLNLSLRLKEELILAPSERAHDAISKKQF